MAGNTAPIYALTASVQWVTSVITAANTAKDGTGTVNLLFTAGANGSHVRRVRAMPAGTNIPSVLRIFVNNGADPTVASNNIYWGDVSLPATTLTEVAGQTYVELPVDMRLNASYRLYVVLGTAVATGWYVCAEGSHY